MAVNNSIQKKAQGRDNITEYESNGEKVKLSPQIIRRYLVSGGGNVTDEEIMMFLSLCRFQHLNPFLREAYLIKYGDTQPATMVVGKDVFLKRARHNKDFGGLQAGIITREIETGYIHEKEGTFYDKNDEELIGGWAKVYIKGYEVPFYASVSLDEYIGRKKNGEVNGQWSSKPATMIRKVAQAQALREAFPDENGGLYAPEEMGDMATAALLEDTPVQVPEEVTEAEEKPEADNVNDVQAALFGMEG